MTSDFSTILYVHANKQGVMSKDKIEGRSAKGVSPPLPTPLADGKFHLWTGGLHILRGKIQGNGKRKTLDKGKKVCTKPDFTLRQFIITIVENKS